MPALPSGPLPLGFRFRPTDEELVNFYLQSKNDGNDAGVEEVIQEIDVCKWEPWDLPGLSVIQSDDLEWFFFCPRDRKYPNGHRSNRATEAGYWKATGKDRMIKSRRSGMKLIGMKKTLVFYKGRAPKGERTHWIMHEYRATEKELDGTNAGQGAFVLCRLFSKRDEQTEISNCNEVDMNGSSPTTSKSSPDGTTSELAMIQESPKSDMQVEKKPVGIERWLADKSDNTTSDAPATVESCCNSYVASDVEDHVLEVTAPEVDPQLAEDPKLFNDPTFEPLDCKVFSPLHSQMHMELGPSYFDSPYANDFGNDHYGVQFIDGTSEQDVCITEFLDAVLKNQEEYSCEESTSQKNSAVESETPKGDQIGMSSARPWINVFVKDSGSSSDVDTEVAQTQVKRKPSSSACFLGVTSMLLLSLHKKLHLAFALLSLTAGSAGVAIADVTIDACVAQNSISHPSLAADLQSLCGLSSSIGALVGFSISGFLVHLLGPKGVIGLLSIPAGLVLLVGVVLSEPHMPNFAYRQVNQKFMDAGKAMWTTLKLPDVWRPCLYMYLSLTLSLSIHDGMFYWYTDSKAGPSFSQENVGFIFSIGSVGSLLGVLLYQNFLKDYPFRNLLFWTQLLFGLSGMLDLMLVLRLNLKFGIPDYFFVVIDEGVSQMIGRLKWMPLLVLSSKLCPSGIEGTFFALLMSIDNFGILTSTWGGGLLLHILKVTRTQFDNLWLAILIRNILRVVPLSLLYLVPRSDLTSSILPTEMLKTKDGVEIGVEIDESDKIELVSLVRNPL